MAIAAAPDSPSFWCTYFGHVVAYDAEGKRLFALHDKRTQCLYTSIAFASTGEAFLSSEFDGSLKILSREGVVQRTFTGRNRTLFNIAIQGNFLYAIDGDGCVRLYNLDPLAFKFKWSSRERATNTFWSLSGLAVSAAGEVFVAANYRYRDYQVEVRRMGFVLHISFVTLWAGVRRTRQLSSHNRSKHVWLAVATESLGD